MEKLKEDKERVSRQLKQLQETNEKTKNQVKTLQEVIAKQKAENTTVCICITLIVILLTTVPETEGC